MTLPVRQRVLESWNSYRERVLPKEAGEIQVTETRRAFFAGAISAYNLCTGRDGSWKSENEGLEVLVDIEKELSAVADRARNGSF